MIVVDTTILVYAHEDDLTEGLEIYRRTDLSAFDAVLAAAAMRSGADALVSADRVFASLPELTHVDPTTPHFLETLTGP